MKKYFLVLLLSLLISLSMSCKINYIDIVELYHQNYSGTVLNEYKRMYNTEGDVIYNVVGVEFLKSSKLTQEQYNLCKEEYGYDFVNILAISSEIDYGNRREKLIVQQIIEFSSKKEAKYALENCFDSVTQEYLCIKNNVLYIENLANYLLLGNKRERKNNMLFSDDVFLKTYLSNDKLVIPDDINKISSYACRNSKINSLVCGESLEIIGYASFAWCRNLANVTLNDKLKKICSYSFSNCNKINSIIIPSSVEYIGEYAFTSGTLYCEASEKPDGWDDEFAAFNVKVYWKDEWYYDDNNIPRLNSEKENI